MSVLWQLTHLYSSSELQLVLIDGKGMSDYLDFEGYPHFISPKHFHVGAVGALELLAEIVENGIPARREVFNAYAREALGRAHPVQITNLRELLADSRANGKEPPLRPLIVIIDEFAELLLASNDRKRFEDLVTRFNQIARAIGGHLIAATQRPSADIVSGVIKANFARLALKVQQAVDSRVILDEGGAEHLLGRGDLLFRSPSGMLRLQGYSALGPYRWSEDR